MKTLVTNIAGFLFVCNLTAQPCLPDGIQFTSQDMIDNFQTLFPNCTEIQGGVYIYPSVSGITNLNGLSNITSIGGSLIIDPNAALTDLDGLNNLTSIGGSLVINGTPIYSLQGLENLTSVGYQVSINGNPYLNSISGLSGLKTINTFLYIQNNPLLQHLDGLEQLDSVQYISISNNALTDLEGFPQMDTIYYLYLQGDSTLTSLKGLDSLKVITSGITISDIPALTDFSAIQNLGAVGDVMILKNLPALSDLSSFSNIKKLRILQLLENPYLTDLNGLSNVDSMQRLEINNNYALVSLSGMTSLKSLQELIVNDNDSLIDLSGLEQVRIYDGYVDLENNDQLKNLNGLQGLDTLGALDIVNSASLESLEGLTNLRSLDFLKISSTPLQNLEGLENTSINIQINIEYNALETLDGLQGVTDVSNLILWSNNLVNLEGLENLTSTYALTIGANFELTNLDGLSNLNQINGSVAIKYNYALSDCAVYGICQFLANNSQGSVDIQGNGPGCANKVEFEEQCNFSPLVVQVLRDGTDATNMPMAAMLVKFTAGENVRLKPTNANGLATFSHFLNAGPFELSLPEIRETQWTIVQTVNYLTSSTGGDSVFVTLHLTPLLYCPETEVKLTLPSNFRGCLVESSATVSVQNIGTDPAEDVRVAVVFPPVLEVISTQPPIAATNGDTLFFEFDQLLPFEQTEVQLKLKTSCDTFLLGQTLCWEVYASSANECIVNLPPYSEIRLSAQCMADTMVRFTLKNIGTASTQGDHNYVLYRNGNTVELSTFSLIANEGTTVDVVADGATYRMDATKFDDGTRTAVAREHCGGLTPGLINAFWLDDRTPSYTIACREVIAAYDPNQKTAAPEGVGQERLLEANTRLHYTIDFQNTGTDTAYRVQLIDVLPAGLNIGTFRPGASSHHCTWEIRGSDTLEILFFPIALPDSNVNEPASHGFFSFEIQQWPDLSDGTNLDNTASIVFDFNPPIITNTVHHTIGKLTVRLDEPRHQVQMWRVLGNPTRDRAVFQAVKETEGLHSFELYNLLGHPVRNASFTGQTYEFRCDGLPAGWYAFRIMDSKGRGGSGKILVVD